MWQQPGRETPAALPGPDRPLAGADPRVARRTPLDDQPRPVPGPLAQHRERAPLGAGRRGPAGVTPRRAAGALLAHHGRRPARRRREQPRGCWADRRPSPPADRTPQPARHVGRGGARQPTISLPRKTRLGPGAGPAARSPWRSSHGRQIARLNQRVSRRPEEAARSDRLEASQRAQACGLAQSCRHWPTGVFATWRRTPSSTSGGSIEDALLDREADGERSRSDRLDELRDQLACGPSPGTRFRTAHASSTARDSPAQPVTTLHRRPWLARSRSDRSPLADAALADASVEVGDRRRTPSRTRLWTQRPGRRLLGVTAAPFGSRRPAGTGRSSSLRDVSSTGADPSSPSVCGRRPSSTSEARWLRRSRSDRLGTSQDQAGTWPRSGHRPTRFRGGRRTPSSTSAVVDR